MTGLIIIGFAYPGDIQILFGAIVGVLFALKNRQMEANPLKIGLIVGVIGCLLSAFSLSLLEFMLHILGVGFGFNRLIQVVFFFFLMALILGLSTGGLFGFYYHYKTKKRRESIPEGDKELYESLKTK